VRVGDTVRRPVGPWTPTIHALLRHLEAAGFDGAPRVLGIDERGREVLEFVPGAMAWPAMGALATDEGLARAARLLRRYHDAVADFVVPADGVWQFPDMAPDCEPFIDGEGVIVCHNDCAAWNLVMGSERWAFIDWDVAGPRPRLWDVAYAVRGMVLVDRSLDVPHRLDVFGNAYGLRDDERVRLPEIVLARIQSSIDLMRRRGEAGEEPWASMWASGHRVAWEETREYARSLLSR
jgi:hypothetical protein